MEYTTPSGPRPVIGVMGGHSAPKVVAESAYRLGRLIARQGWILLTGGRGVGVMDACSRGAKEAGGLVVGLLPGGNRRGASEFLDVAICTSLGDGRNLINVLSSDVVIVCPGKLGTLSELVFAIKHRKPVVLLGPEPGTDLRPYLRRTRCVRVDSPEDAVARTADFLSTSSAEHRKARANKVWKPTTGSSRQGGGD